MKALIPTLAISISYYYPLLQKYALRILNNEDIASFIAQEVLETQYQIDGLVPSEFLILFLKTDLYNRCELYKIVAE